MKKRKRLRNKIVSAVLVFLLVSTGLIQPVSAQVSDSSGNKEPEIMTEMATSNVNGANQLEEQQNALGQLTQGGMTSLSGVTLSIHKRDADEWYDAVTDENGNFGFWLPDGQYQLDGIWLEAESKWYPLEDKIFTVLDGQLMDVDALKIDLPAPEKDPINVKGSIIKDGKPLVGTLFSIHSTDGSDLWYDATTDANGAFGFELPDGEYKLDGIWDSRDSKWHQVDRTISIVGGILQGSSAVKIELTTQVEQPVKGDVTGKVLNNGKPVANEAFSIHTTDGSDVWFDARTDSEGQFSLIDVPNGEYQLDGIWASSENKWYELNEKFTVNGDTVKEFNLTPKGLVTGEVVKTGTPVAGEWLSIHTTGAEPVWYDIRTGEQGDFNVILPDGEYQLDGVWVTGEEKWYPLGTVFTVQNGVLVGAETLHLELDKLNVKGSLQKNGKALSSVWISVHTTTGEELWYNAQTDENGKFAFDLSDGNYQLNGVWLAAEAKWYPLEVSFEVLNDKLTNPESLLLDLTEQEPNVKGSVLKDGQALSGVWVSAHTTSGAEIWYDAKADENGRIQFVMPNGEYQIEGIWVAAEAKWYPLAKQFVVENGVLVGAEELTLELLAPTTSIDNVNGSISKDGQAVPNVQLNAYSETTGIWYSAQADEQGLFSFKLPDGDYNMEGVWVSKDKTWYPKQIAFTVQDGALVGQSELAIELLSPTSGNITGTLKDENGPVAKAYMEIINNGTGMPEAILLTNNSGAFGTQLEDGDYTVESIFGLDSESYTYIGKQFSVTSGKLYVDGVLVQSLDVMLPPESLTLQLMDQGNILTDVSVALETEINGRDVEFNSFSDENGNIKFRLNDGEYKVIGFYNYLDDTYTYFDNQYITVANGTTSPNPYVLDVSELVKYTTVYGSLSDSYEFIGDAEVYFYNQNTGESFAADVYEDGSFVAELSDGTYSVEVYSDSFGYISDVKVNDVNQGFIIDNGDVYVDGTSIDSLNLTIPDESLKVQIVKNGSPVQGEVNIYNNERSVLVETDENGEVTLRLPTGEYMIGTVYVGDTVYPVNQLVWAEHDLLDTVVVDIANVQGDVTGTVLDGGNPLANAEFYIQNRSDSWEMYYVVTDENGKFSADIPDGDYVIVDVSNTSTGELVYPNLFFSVANGNIIVNNQTVSQLTVDLPGESLNVQLLTNGSPIIGEVFLSRQVNGFDFYYYAMTDDNGVFSLRVPDGVYSVDEAYNENQYFNINEVVSVVGGTTSPNPYVINLGEELPPGTVQGIIQDENGPLANADFFISDEYNNWRYIGTDSSGKFSTTLNDGNYKVAEVRYGDSSNSVYINLEFSVVDGKLFVNGVANAQLTITVPPVTVNGVISDASGPLSGGVSVYSVDGTTQEYFGYFNTDVNGKFSARLVDGQYAINGVNLTGSNSVPVVVKFEVINGNLYVDQIQTEELVINIPAVSVIGTVLDASGSAVPNVSININGTNGNYNWYYAYVDQEGKFALRLPDGDYNVNTLNMNTEPYESTVYQLPFTIQDGLLYVNGELQADLQLKVPEVNFTGQIVDDGVPIPYATLTVFNKLATNSYVHVTVSSDENGNFARRFGDGSYVIRSMESTSGNVTDLNIPFEVINGVPSKDFSTIDAGAVYGNVTGTVTDQGVPVTEGTLYIIDQSRMNQYSAQVNVDGEFGLDLPDNDYEITGFYSNATGHVELRSSFSVINGEIFISGEKVVQLDVTIPAVSLKGTVQDEAETPLPYASFFIKSVVNGEYSDYRIIHTDGQGYFEERLADGVYEVTRIENGSNPYPVSMSFEIHGGLMYVDGIIVPSLTIQTPPKTFFGKILNEGVPVENVEVTIIDENRNTDIQYFHAQTDVNGNFSLSLPDGVYKIGSIYGYEQYEYYGVYRNFEVINGETGQNNPHVFEVGESQPIGGNLQGIVMDENGPAPSVTVDVYSVTDEVYGVTDEVYGVTDDVYGDQVFVSYSVKTNSEGLFGVDIPDGDYTLGFQGDVELPFSVIDGKIFVNGVETSLVELMIPPITLKGILSENGEPSSDALIMLIRNDKMFDVTTDENGRFTARLPDGEYHFLRGYTDYGNSEFNTTFTIEGGLLYQNGIRVDEIQLSPANSTEIFGKVLKGINPVQYVGFGVYRVFPEAEYQSTYGYTNDKGEFSLDLVDGDYLVKSIWSDGDHELNLRFTIKDGQVFVNETKQDMLTINIP